MIAYEIRYCHDTSLRFGSLGTGDFCIAADMLHERVNKASGDRYPLDHWSAIPRYAELACEDCQAASDL